MIVIDERGTMSCFSAAAERLFGYRHAEAIGKNVSMLMPIPYREALDGYLGLDLLFGLVVIGRRGSVVARIEEAFACHRPPALQTWRQTHRTCPLKSEQYAHD